MTFSFFEIYLKTCHHSEDEEKKIKQKITQKMSNSGSRDGETSSLPVIVLVLPFVLIVIVISTANIEGRGHESTSKTEERNQRKMKRRTLRCYS